MIFNFGQKTVSPHIFLLAICCTRLFLHLCLQNYTALVLRSLIGFGVGAVAPTAFGLVLDITNPGEIQRTLGYLPNWGWAFSMLGLVALIGPWAMMKLRSMPESRMMAGGKK